jgi:hypothetical protein
MLIFIDESGVHKQDGKSSVVLVYVTIENKDTIEKAIVDIESRLKIESFHWVKHIWKIRYNFIEALIKENFSVKAAIIRNPFRKADFENALETLLIEKRVSKIIIDGKKPKWYSQKIKKALRDRGISVRKIITGNDKAFPCLRLADAFAGLIRVYWDEPDNEKAQGLFRIANKKITTQLLSGQATR